MSTSGNLLSGFKLNKNLTIFLVCVVMASLFWLLNALSKSYVVAISVPLEYVGVPDNAIMVNNPTRLVQVRVEGEGYSLLGLGDEEHSPAEIDLGDVFPEKIDEIERAIVNTKYLQRQIQDEVGSSIKILGISHDSIGIEVEPVVKKSVRVIPQITPAIKKGYIQTRISISPEVVSVSGPRSIIDTLSGFVVAHQVDDVLEDNYKKELKTKPEKLLSVENESFEIEIAVEQITEGTFKIPVRALHVPDSLKLNLYPNQVEVKFTAPVSRFDSVSVQDFRAVVDFKTAQGGKIQKLLVKVIGPNGDVKMIGYSPKRLEYIIRKL